MAGRIQAQHRKKKRVRLHDRLPFPVPIASITGETANKGYWYYYTGYLKDNCVMVTHSGDISALYRMGFFGRGLFSRGAPSLYKNLPTVHVPVMESEEPERLKVMRRRMYLRHRHWCASQHSPQSGPDGQVRADDISTSTQHVEFDSDIEYPEEQYCYNNLQMGPTDTDIVHNSHENQNPDWLPTPSLDNNQPQSVQQRDAFSSESDALQRKTMDDIAGVVWRERVSDVWASDIDATGNAADDAELTWDVVDKTTAMKDDWDTMEADADFWGVEAPADVGNSNSDNGAKENAETADDASDIQHDETSVSRVRKVDDDGIINSPIKRMKLVSDRPASGEAEVSDECTTFYGKHTDSVNDNCACKSEPGESDAHEDMKRVELKCSGRSKEQENTLDFNSGIKSSESEASRTCTSCERLNVSKTGNSSDTHINSDIEIKNTLETQGVDGSLNNKSVASCDAENKPIERLIVCLTSSENLEKVAANGAADNIDLKCNTSEKPERTCTLKCKEGVNNEVEVPDRDGGDVEMDDVTNGDEAVVEETQDVYHPYCRDEDESGKYLVIEDSDCDDNTIGVQRKQVFLWQPVRKKDAYHFAEPLVLSPEEAYFLSYGLGCLTVKDETETPCTLTQLWKRFSSAPHFLPRYVAYHYFRSKGWVPKTGLGFGVDFIVYKVGPAFYHASYSVIVKVVEEESMRELAEYMDRKLTWKTLSGLNRVTEHVAKMLMLCYVIVPKNLTDDEKLTSECLSRFTVKLQIVNRWVSSQERDQDKEVELDML